jgi:hypothetical protein
MKKIFLSLVFIISFGLNAVGEQECVLCYEPMMSYQETITLSCLHTSHKSCFDLVERYKKSTQSEVIPICPCKLSQNPDSFGVVYLVPRIFFNPLSVRISYVEYKGDGSSCLVDIYHIIGK